MSRCVSARSRGRLLRGSSMMRIARARRPGHGHQGGELMPTYEYRCEDCGHEFVAVLTISEHDKGKPRCPKCSSEKVQQAVSGVFVKTSRKS